MKLINPTFDLDAFFDKLHRAPQRLLLLDYDGTLAPFKVDRSKATPYPEILPLLNDICECERTHLTIVSGRAARSVVALLGMNRTPQVFGSHGAERLEADGTYSPPSIEPTVWKALEEAAHWAEANDLAPRIERKPAGIAFHWRGLPGQETERLKQVLRTECRRWCNESGLQLHEFDGGLELRLPGITKGDVVRMVLRERADHSAVAYLGDDTTDEDAFDALGERGLSVLVRPEQRKTRADLWLRPPDELAAFLRRWLECCR